MAMVQGRGGGIHWWERVALGLGLGRRRELVW